MRFQAATLFSVFSLSLLSSTVALPLEGSSLAARDEAYARDVNEVYARDADEVYARDIDEVYARDVDEVYARDVDEVYTRDIDNALWARKPPKVSFALQKGKLNSKDRQTAEEQAEDALAHYGYKAGTVIYAYHLSNGESVEHITIEPQNGKKIHAYRDGIFTQGDERRSKRDLYTRAKAPKVTFALQKGKLSSKDRQTAEGQAQDALEHYGYKAGTVIYAYHLSNGETVEHITIEPQGNGKKIHAYRDGIFTQGDERRP